MARENTGILMKCRRCLGEVPMSEMKYARDGKTLVCKRCQNVTVEEHLGKMKGATKYDASPPTTKRRYACTACGFTFSRGNITSKRCPYCAKESVVPSDTISSAKLLDE